MPPARSPPSSPSRIPRTGSPLLIRRLARYGDPAAMPGRHRAPERPAGGPAAGGRAPGGAGQPERDQDLAGGRGAVRRQVRRRRRRGDRRVPAAAPATGCRSRAPYSDETLALRTVVRTRGDLVEMRVAATNQLSALLEAHWPGAKAIFADVESPISLDFLTRYPTPAAAAHLGEKRMAAFCVKHGYSGRRPPPSCSPGCAPPRPAPPTRPSPRRSATPSSPLVAVLTALNAAVKDLDRSVAAHLGEHPDGDDLHVAAKVGSGQRRPDARRVGRLPPSLRRARLRRRPRRLHPRHQGNPASTAPCTSAGPATSASASR